MVRAENLWGQAYYMLEADELVLTMAVSVGLFFLLRFSFDWLLARVEPGNRSQEKTYVASASLWGAEMCRFTAAMSAVLLVTELL